MSEEGICMFSDYDMIHEHCQALQTVFPHISKDLITKLLREKQFTNNCLDVVSNILINDYSFVNKEVCQTHCENSTVRVPAESTKSRVNFSSNGTHNSDCEIIHTELLPKPPVYMARHKVFESDDILIISEGPRLESVDNAGVCQILDSTTISEDYDSSAIFHNESDSYIDLENSPFKDDYSGKTVEELISNTEVSGVNSVCTNLMDFEEIGHVENDVELIDEIVEKEAKAMNIILPQFSVADIRYNLMLNLDVKNRFEFTLNNLCSKTETVSDNIVHKPLAAVGKPRITDIFAEPTSSGYLEYFDKAAHVFSADSDMNVNYANRQDSSKPPLADSVVSSTSELSSNICSNPAVDHSLENQKSYILEIIPDADPKYITQRLLNITNNKEGVDKLVSELLDSKTYPKLMPPTAVTPSECVKQKFFDLTLKEFLALFDNENPRDYFYHQKRTVTPSYIQNCKNYLKMNYPYISVKNIYSVLKDCNNLLSPAVRALKEWKAGLLSNKRFFKAGSQIYETDEEFFKEMAYLRLKIEIDHYFLETKEARSLEFIEAKLNGSLLECTICCEEELVSSDMLPCELGHIFCKSCVKRHAEEMIGQAKTYFPCLETDCDEFFSYTVLQELLKPSVFSRLLQKKQTEEILAANIPDLESCPFCNFATIMPNKDDKLFRCLNPECNRESCRLCKEPNHIPLRCDEVEKADEAKVRTTIEDQLSKAVIRECYKCKKKFIKEEGCNKMTCSCGAQMCYLCKSPVTGYGHFSESDSNKCPLWSDTLVVHTEEMRRTAVEVKEKLLTENPHVQLKHDPTRDIPEVPNNRKRKHEEMRNRLQNWEVQFAEMQRAYARGQLPANMNLENLMIAHRNVGQLFARGARRRRQHH